MTSRADVLAGRVAAKEIENGVVVPPGLRINELTFTESLAQWATRSKRPMDRDEALANFPEEREAVEAYFGLREPAACVAA